MPPSPTAPTGTRATAATAGSLESGAMGTLGTNVLQQDIDTLSTRVQSLTDAINNLVQNMQTGGATGGLGSQGATRQQGPGNSNSGFPNMIDSSRIGQQTSGGNGGYGNNQSGMTSGGYSSNRSMYSGNGGFTTSALALVGSVAGYGAAQSQNLVGLNSYATQSLTGYNYNGMSQNQAMQQLYAQAGATPNSLLSIGTGSLQDNLQFAQTLQGAAGSSNISQTARGAAALSAAYGFGITNPNLTAASAASMGAGLYSPMLSYNMQALGYGKTILSRSPGGVNLNAGQSAQAILQGLNLKGATSQQVTAAFASGGKASVSMPYLLQGTNITSSAMQSYLTDYAQLMSNDKLSASKASTLMTQAASGTAAQMKSARSQLSKLGINTANNDLSSLVQNQASQTGRSGDVAAGFNSGLQQSAGLLEDFNNALNRILKGPLGTALGYGGGSLGTIAGSALGSGTNMLGTAGSYMLMKKLGGMLGKGGTTASAGGAEDAAAMGAEGAVGTAGGGLLAGLGAVALPVAALAAGGLAFSHWDNARINTGNITSSNKLLSSYQSAISKYTGSNKAQVTALYSKLAAAVNTVDKNPQNMGDVMSMVGISHQLSNMLPATKGGGATGAGMATTQNRTAGNSQSASVSVQARKAVSAAESQKGVPYVYGQETPGVGFDCSALVQWAYKQAGISLPRTSQQQWAALSRRSVPVDRVEEGDLVFMAGSDGTDASPGHVGMMINSHQLIQAPQSGQDVEIISYDPHAWQHAARPSGSGSFIAGSTGIAGTAAGSNNTGAGNRGMSGGLGGSYGSVNEADVINAMGSYMSGSSGGATTNSNGSSGAKNTVTGAGAGGGSSNVPVSATRMAAIAKQIAQKYGWSTGQQWSDFVKVENREAGWNLNAQNPSSSAFGVAQFINGASEYYSYGGNPNTPQGQFTAMFNYIKQRYGSPAGAWQSETTRGFYAAGGMTLPGLAIVGERGPELMMQGGGNQVFSNAQTMQLINAIRGSSPGQSPWKTDVTSGGTGNSPSVSPAINLNFGTSSIVINSSGNSTQAATQTAREITRQLVKNLGNASVHQAIKNGDKL
jgi:cell wall-associated NlpC family hydrolase